jgi:hypothetical protein
MIKKVIDFNRLPKQEYQKPVMEVIEADIEQQILAGSVTSVTTTGLDDDLILPDDEEPKSGSVWEEAW